MSNKKKNLDPEMLKELNEATVTRTHVDEAEAEIEKSLAKLGDIFPKTGGKTIGGLDKMRAKNRQPASSPNDPRDLRKLYRRRWQYHVPAVLSAIGILIIISLIAMMFVSKLPSQNKQNSQIDTSSQAQPE